MLSLILLVILFVIIAIKMISSTKRDVSHPRLKFEAWWLNRKNQARTPTNLDEFGQWLFNYQCHKQVLIGYVEPNSVKY